MQATEMNFADQLQAVLDDLNGPGALQARSALGPHTMMRNEWDDALRASVAEDLGDLLTEGGVRGMARLPRPYLEIGFDVTNPEVQTFLQQYPMNFARKINERTANRLVAEFTDGLNNGETVRELSDRVMGTLGPDASRYRADMIARTESSRAQHAGQNFAWRQSRVVIGEAWEVAPDACEFCEGMRGMMAALDENFVDLGGRVEGIDGGTMVNNYEAVGFPPLHPHCVTGDTLVSPKDVVSAYRASYRGELIELTLADGAWLRVTPNHLLLTRHGFARADSLMEGDDVIYSPVVNGSLDGIPDDYGKPTRIEEVFDTLAVTPGMTVCRVPVAPEYLHGDARFVDGHIDVVVPDSLLERVGYATLQEVDREAYLAPSHPAVIGLHGGSDLTAVLMRLALAADGIMGGRREATAFSGRRLAHAKVHGGTTAPRQHAEGAQVPDDERPRYVELLRKSLDGLPLGMKQSKIVVANRQSDFSGHVFDLQTVAGLYLPNGLLSSNCRCTTSPLMLEPE